MGPRASAETERQTDTQTDTNTHTHTHTHAHPITQWGTEIMGLSWFWLRLGRKTSTGRADMVSLPVRRGKTSKSRCIILVLGTSQLYSVLCMAQHMPVRSICWVYTGSMYVNAVHFSQGSTVKRGDTRQGMCSGWIPA